MVSFASLGFLILVFFSFLLLLWWWWWWLLLFYNSWLLFCCQEHLLLVATTSLISHTLMTHTSSNSSFIPGAFKYIQTIDVYILGSPPQPGCQSGTRIMNHFSILIKHKLACAIWGLCWYNLVGNPELNQPLFATIASWLLGRSKVFLTVVFFRLEGAQKCQEWMNKL